MINIQKKNKGFTLIELLVVIAVIGLLAGIVLVAVNNAREKARDVERETEIRQIYTAIQLYYDENDTYPSEAWCDSSIGSCNHACPCDEDNWSVTSGIYTALVGGGYISELPIDPINDTTYYYIYEPECTAESCQFYLRAKLEQGGNFDLWDYE